MDDECIARNPAQHIARKPVPIRNTEAAHEPLLDTPTRRDNIHDDFDAATENDHDSASRRSEPSGHEPKGASVERRTSKRSLSIMKSWWQEILWCAISLAAFVALVLVLKEFNQKPLPRWPSGITLNTIIAALSTIARTAFLIPVLEGLSQSKWAWYKKKPRPLTDFDMFDQASRGPWGSLGLLVRTKGWIVGIVSALLLTSAIATSTLTQFTVTYPSRNVTITTEGSAAAWRTPYYFWRYSDITHLAEITRPEREGATGTNISLPNGIKLHTTYGYSTVLIESKPTLSYKNTQMEKASLYNYFAVQGPGSGSQEIDLSEVILHWCINTCNAAVTNNNISVERVLSHTEVSSGDMEWPNGGSGNISYLTSPLDEGNKYIFGGTGVAGIQTLLDDSLPSLTVDVGSNSIKDGSAMLLQAIRDAGNWQDAVDGMARNIAMGLTNSLLGANSNVIGEALQSEVYVDVHWPWLALLAAQILFSIIFLVLVVIETATSNIAVVKSSTLPAIFAINATEKAGMESRFQQGECGVGKDDYQLVPSGIGGELRKTGGKWALGGGVKD
ncbi:hypothetical protein CGCS363_v001682 [Colletotrichum siamense]|uniref:uncharacterized protein n=1 Tax=Colletotrichum siamense TaxID=690259 RepID=UPI001872E61D|nr:uncharacterized protein CGCS363_v001682 [Colletotrichum siamense]KAF5515254.1 hypothetical protein CGCS363_v001682 [Colletotrichum siamense]